MIKVHETTHKPFLVYRSTSTVGLPRESNISRAWIFRIDMVQDLQTKHSQVERLRRLNAQTTTAAPALLMVNEQVRKKI